MNLAHAVRATTAAHRADPPASPRSGQCHVAAAIAAIDEAIGFFRQFSGVLNSDLEGQGFVVGDGLTVADFKLASFLPYAHEAKLPLDEFPEIRRWYGKLEQLDTSIYRIFGRG
jgi:glutathione S-transferase